MKDFYVEVLSNASYLSNTVAEFRNQIQLLHPLDGEWEVGLSEISYTKSWYNVAFNSTLDLIFKNENFFPIIDYNHFNFVAYEARSGTLKRGDYSNVSILIAEIQKELEVYNDPKKVKVMPKLFYDFVATKHLYIIPGVDVHDMVILPYLDHDLRELLGFEHYDYLEPKVNNQGLVESNRPPDLTMGIRQLLVYCNLIVPQYVGDSRTKLLRVVEIPNDAKFNDQITISYEKPHYAPILFNDFDEIEINIKDDVGNLIRFQSGRTRVKLHFRKI